jgi:tetratricopeptide (TPR) repeat protein
MKATALLFLPLGFFLTTVAAQNQTAPADPKVAATQQALQPNQQAFLNLPEESRKAFVKHLGEAFRFFQQKRVFETLNELDKASAIFKDSPEIYNLRGSCYVEIRSFDKALAEFKKAIALSKDNPSILFNIAEVYFVTKEWQKAVDGFETALKLMPPNDLTFGRLTEFKILLGKKKLGKKDEVAALSEKHDALDDSPYYYFSKAIIAYDNKDRAKAEEWLAMAGRIFQNPPGTLAPWQDTLIEYGYIKSFYGADSEEQE